MSVVSGDRVVWFSGGCGMVSNAKPVLRLSAVRQPYILQLLCVHVQVASELLGDGGGGWGS